MFYLIYELEMSVIIFFVFKQFLLARIIFSNGDLQGNFCGGTCLFTNIYRKTIINIF